MAASHGSVEMTLRQLQLARAAGQYLLHDAGPGLPAELVQRMVGVNAQRTSAMMLSLRARMPGLDRGYVNKLIDEKRSLARTWAMRGTLHLVDSEDLRWLVSLLGPVSLARTERRRSELGLGGGFLSRALTELKKAMSKAGPMTRWELMDALEPRGISLRRESQAPIHLILYAALSGLVCLGPERVSGEQTYVLLDEWIGKGGKKSAEPSAAKLVGRYLEGYGPASSVDFSSWSGMPISRVRDTWGALVEAGKLREVNVAGRPMWINAGDAGRMGRIRVTRPRVRLLPAFDAYVLAYSDRETLMPKEALKRVYHGGQTLPTIVVNGAVVGAWRYESRGKRMLVQLSPFKPLGDRIRALVDGEARDIGRFFGLDADVRG